MTGPVKVRFVGSAAMNFASPLDGRWLVDFAPCSAEEADEKDGHDPDVFYGAAPSFGGVCPIKIEATADESKARLFADVAEAHAMWAMVMPDPFAERIPDGKPNRPLTAYTIEVTP